MALRAPSSCLPMSFSSLLQTSEKRLTDRTFSPIAAAFSFIMLNYLMHEDEYSLRQYVGQHLPAGCRLGESARQIVHAETGNFQAGTEFLHSRSPKILISKPWFDQRRDASTKTGPSSASPSMMQRRIYLRE